MSHRRFRAIVLLIAASTFLGGCSVRKLAMKNVADALAGGGTSFSEDNDPELIRDALPFSLKLMESLLVETPRHVGLLTSLSSGFTQYGYAFLEQEADQIEEDDLEKARELQERARGFYLRARDYALRGLEIRHPGFTNSLAAGPANAARMATKNDVPLLYWSAASWAAAISRSKDEPAMIGDLPKVEALLFRALELDESWGRGAIHSLLISYEMSRATGEGDPVERARQHFERARELGGGNLASPIVTYAESVCIPIEDGAQFESLLKEALAIDVNVEPAFRVENIVMQRRARWLLGRTDKLFLPPLH